MTDFIENGVYFVIDCYGTNYSMLYREDTFIYMSNKGKKSKESIVDAIENDYITLIEFVDTLDNF